MRLAGPVPAFHAARRQIDQCAVKPAGADVVGGDGLDCSRKVPAGDERVERRTVAASQRVVDADFMHAGQEAGAIDLPVEMQADPAFRQARSGEEEAGWRGERRHRPRRSSCAGVVDKRIALQRALRQRRRSIRRIDAAAYGVPLPLQNGGVDDAAPLLAGGADRQRQPSFDQAESEAFSLRRVPLGDDGLIALRQSRPDHREKSECAGQQRRNARRVHIGAGVDRLTGAAISAVAGGVDLPEFQSRPIGIAIAADDANERSFEGGALFEGHHEFDRFAGSNAVAVRIAEDFQHIRPFRSPAAD